MGIYLNPGNKSYWEAVHSKIYVDKTGLIAYTNEFLNTREKYICVSRPRRFGKSMTLDMLAAYYSCGCDSGELFKGFRIESHASFEEHLNKYDVLFLNMQRFLSRAKDQRVTDYLEKTNAIPGVGRTKVTRVWNTDISPAEMIPKESVERWYDSTKETLSGEVRDWLNSVFRAAKEKKLTTGGTVLLTIINSEFGAASETLVQKVQTAMDPEVNAGEGYGLAPMGHVVKVESAKERKVTVKASLIFEPGYGWNNLQGLLEEAVSDYLLELRKEWADASYLVVRISQIDTRLLNVQGVLDVQNTSINGVMSNLSLEKYEIPVLGGVSG